MLNPLIMISPQILIFQDSQYLRIYDHIHGVLMFIYLNRITMDYYLITDLR